MKAIAREIQYVYLCYQWLGKGIGGKEVGHAGNEMKSIPHNVLTSSTVTSKPASEMVMTAFYIWLAVRPVMYVNNDGKGYICSGLPGC